jgi:5'-nucleotidase
MSEKLILITNDDGVHAPGLKALQQKLSSLGRVIVVAPHHQRSGTSHALTTDVPLRIKELDKDFYSVSGYPADCVYAAMYGLLPKKPDLTVSGINNGANLGIDVYYSGTVAGIRQSVIDGVNGFAVSLVIDDNKEHFYWDDVAEYSRVIAKKMLEQGYKKNGFLNINYPNIPAKNVKGTKITKLGDRRYVQELKSGKDPRGKDYYWLWGAYNCFSNIEGTDCVAVNEGYVSITPISLDLTDHDMLNELKGWSV